MNNPDRRYPKSEHPGNKEVDGEINHTPDTQSSPDNKFLSYCQEHAQNCRDLAAALKDYNPPLAAIWEKRAQYWQTFDLKQRKGPEWMQIENEKDQIANLSKILDSAD